VVYDTVNASHDYRQGHLPGAINLPNGQWHKASGLSREKTNVVYCYSQTCHLAAQAAQAALEFLSQGYRGESSAHFERRLSRLPGGRM
jgi:rhodanese-related sulfurtransferase